jgi:hypothetical protein
MMYQSSKLLKKTPMPTNKGIVGLPSSAALSSYNQLNTQPGLLE